MSSMAHGLAIARGNCYRISCFFVCVHSRTINRMDMIYYDVFPMIIINVRGRS